MANDGELGAAAQAVLAELFKENPQFEDIANQYANFMYNSDDLAVAVLRGHLLIEEMLTRIIGKFIPHGELLEDVGLRFFQKMQLAKALSWDEHQNGMWQFIALLNQVRNQLAHALLPPKLKGTLASMRAHYKKEFGRDVGEVKGGDPDIELVKAVVIATMGFLAQFESEVERFRWWLSKIDRIVNPHRHKQAQGKPHTGSLDPAEVE